MPPRPLVLFDLDGTLLDTMELLLASARHAFDGYDGRVPTDAEWLAGVGTPLMTQLRGFTRAEHEVDALVERYRAYQRLHHDRLTRCFVDTLQTVRSLHASGYRMGVVTSKVGWLARRGLDHTGLAPYMELVVGADDTLRHKPDPEPVRFALDRLGVAADAAVYVGDSPFDMASGSRAGVVAVGATWGPFSREELAAAGAHHFLDCLGELPLLLERLSASEPAGEGPATGSDRPDAISWSRP